MALVLDEDDRFFLECEIRDAEFPAVLVFKSRGLSSWAPEIVRDEEVLRAYMASDECPEWDQSGFLSDKAGVELISAREYFESVLVPDFRWYAEELVEEFVYLEGVGHMDVERYLDGCCCSWTHKGWLPEDHDGYEE